MKIKRKESGNGSFKKDFQSTVLLFYSAAILYGKEMRFWLNFNEGPFYFAANEGKMVQWCIGRNMYPNGLNYICTETAFSLPRSSTVALLW